MRLVASFLALLSLVTPTLAVDPKSVPVLIKDCTKHDPRYAPNGATMTRSNHPCWTVRLPTSGISKAFGSSLVNGNFTLWQYNLEGNANATLSQCDMNVARTMKSIKTWTNIQLRTCIPEIGFSFDWAPVDRYIGYSEYYGSRSGVAKCDDSVEIPHQLKFGSAIKVDWCDYDGTKYVEWGNNTVSDCRYESRPSPSSPSTSSPTYSPNSQGDCGGKRSCDPAYRYDTCVKSSESSDVYYYYTTFGGPLNNNGAINITTSHINIFTIITMCAMAFKISF